MHYEDVRKKVKGPLGRNVRLRESLLNQCRLHEGESAKRELEAELSAINHRTPTFSGASNKQLGWRDGHKLGDGRWKFVDGKWQKQK
jgi:hypothetical protein